MIMQIPHRVVDDVAKGIAGAAKGLVSSLAGAAKGAGEGLMGGLDKAFPKFASKEGPHRIIDHVADGIVDAGVNFANQGLIGSAQIAGEGLMRALDQPAEQIKGITGLELPELPFGK